MKIALLLIPAILLILNPSETLASELDELLP